MVKNDISWRNAPLGNTYIDSTHTPINFTSHCSFTNVLIRPYALSATT